MPLASGARLGPYKIVGLLGSGGMGEVYKARDTRLDRIVAIKVLPARFAADPQFRERFEREAKAISSLDHPNICTLYDVGQENGVDFLVMQYLEGETLADRLKKGALPLDQALQYAIEIADALDKAHRQGIVHRDLKPGNIMLTKMGAARQGSLQTKVLDFGLAKLGATPASTLAGVSALPTQEGLTAHGAILGTFQYMAPEQLEGKETDARTDIFAFGAVVYEMLTGEKAFEGKSQASLIAAILDHDPPPISTSQPLTPPALDRIVKKCLAKEPERRWQSANDLTDELSWVAGVGSQAGVPSGAVQGGPAPVVAPGKSPFRHTRLAWSIGMLFLAVAIAVGAVAYFQRASVDTRVYRSTLLPPATVTLSDPSVPARRFALSPDGRRLAFTAAGPDGRVMLWVRPLDGLVAQPLAGTEDALAPFWSPDSRFVGFFAGALNGKLKKIDAAGGPPLTLCDVPSQASGATWSRNDVILFSSFGTAGGIRRVSAAGGAPSVVTAPDQKNGETQYRWPFFLPDGQHFLYLALGGAASNPLGIYVASLDSTERKLVVRGGSNAKYAQGYLLFLREQTLMAQPFDAGRLELGGDAVPIAEQVQLGGAGAVTGAFAVSETGVLAYQAGSSSVGVRSQLVWFDRAGKQISVLGDQAEYEHLELSPDGKRAAVTVVEPGIRNRDIWLYELARGLRTRFTFDPAAESSALWSPDGSRLVFNSGRKGRLDLYQKPSSGAGTEEVFLEEGDFDKYPYGWTPDGRFFLYSSSPFASATGSDLWVLPLSDDRPSTGSGRPDPSTGSGSPRAGSRGEPAGLPQGQADLSSSKVEGRKPFVFLQTPFNEGVARLSPGGQWVAYTSNESRRNEVYVTPFPKPGGKWQVSTAGGNLARWRRDGREIFYLAPDNKLMAAEVNGQGPGFEVGEVRPLFQTRARTDLLPGYAYDVSADGQRFLVNTVVEQQQTTSAPITLVVNWTAGLKK